MQGYKEIKFEHLLLGNKGCDILKSLRGKTKDAKSQIKIHNLWDIINIRRILWVGKGFTIII